MSNNNTISPEEIKTALSEKELLIGDIASLINVSASNRRELRVMLKEMVATKEIVLVRASYYSLPGTPAHATSLAWQASEDKETQRRRASMNAIDARGGVFMSKGGCVQGKGLLVLDAPQSFRDAYAKGRKSGANCALDKLDGLLGTVGWNKKKTAFVLVVGRGAKIRVGTQTELGIPLETLNEHARAGKAWWCKTTNGGGMASLWVTCEK